MADFPTITGGRGRHLRKEKAKKKEITPAGIGGAYTEIPLLEVDRKTHTTVFIAQFRKKAQSIACQEGEVQNDYETRFPSVQLMLWDRSSETMTRSMANCSRHLSDKTCVQLTSTTSSDAWTES